MKSMLQMTQHPTGLFDRDPRLFGQGVIGTTEALPACDTCGGMGYVVPEVPVGHPLFGKAVLCPSKTCPAAGPIRQVRIQNLFQTAGIPSGYAQFTLEGFLEGLDDEQKAGKLLALTAMKRYIRDGGWLNLQEVKAALGLEMKANDGISKNSVVITGPYGTGKTALMVAVAKKLLDLGFSVIYIRLDDMFREVMNRYSSNTDTDAETALMEFKKATLLIIDEADVEDRTPHKKAMFENVVRYRYANKLPILMTTNQGKAEFRDNWNERTQQALLDMAHWLRMDGSNLRALADESGEQ
jgi:DNA replication protein DnaC